ncbi:hypothetical protein NDN08_007550 [Rhodosorus marinus]|uniref:EngB-type G domain-containing protein n=1 Tax=Rhodosorus marinus TaxID=101924 RepID=A0AAV8UY61_9RHOD|nr:hypothetical protein NDN08_007550 [Rhodosorus marinus]
MIGFVNPLVACGGTDARRRSMICNAKKPRSKRGFSTNGKDEELERIASEWRRKQKREEEKKTMKKEKEEKIASQQAKRAADKKNRSSSTMTSGDGGAAPTSRKNPYVEPAKSSGRTTLKPEEVAGVRFGGSFTMDIPRTRVPEIAFMGRSNVGKSSTINCLTGLKKKVAKTSKQPGRTQQINFFILSDAEQQDLATLVDLPGYGFAKIGMEDQRSIEVFLEKYLSDREELKLVVILVDSRREPQATDIALVNTLRQFPCKTQIVMTKIDLMTPSNLSKNAQAFAEAAGLTDDDEDLIFFSAVTGQGRGLLWQAAQEAIAMS